MDSWGTMYHLKKDTILWSEWVLLRLIWVFAECSCYFVGLVITWIMFLWQLCFLAEVFYLINSFETNGIFHSLIKLRKDGPLYILKGHSYNIHQNSVFLSLKIDYVLANSADPDRIRLMRHLVWVFMVCQCTIPFRGFQSSKLRKLICN